METLGQKLRRARESQGLSIEEAASRLKIHPKYFEAIERNDISSLPGGFFYRSFVRQYATMVRLPEAEYATELQLSLERDIRDSSQTQPAVHALDYEVPPLPTGNTDSREETKRWMWRLALLLLVMGIGSGVYVLWERWAQLGLGSPAPAVQEPAAAKPEVQKQTEQVQATPEPAPPTVVPAPEPQPAPASAQPTEPSQKSVQVVVTAREMVWVDAWVGGKRIFSNLLKAGDSQTFAADEPIRVRYGNAGGAEIQWNGKGIEPPGPRGQIRTWEYLPTSYRFVPPPPKPEPTQALLQD